MNEFSSVLQSAITMQEYRNSRANVFPSDNALQWFTRSHMADLAKNGAIIAPAGRKLVVPDRFDAEVARIGGLRACSRLR